MGEPELQPGPDDDHGDDRDAAASPEAEVVGSPMQRMWDYWTKRHRENWWQLMKFSIVGGSGVIVNLIVYELFRTGGIDYRVAAVIAFAVANVNNYIWNRYWSFPRAEHSMMLEYVRFLAVGLLALGVNILVLTFMVEDAGMGELLAQVIAVIVATPVGFIGNKLFTFKARTPDDLKS